MEHQEIIDSLITRIPIVDYSKSEMQKQKGKSKLNDLFYEFYRKSLPLGEQTIVGIDKITAYSDSFIKTRNKLIANSPSRDKAIDNQLIEIEGLRKWTLDDRFDRFYEQVYAEDRYLPKITISDAYDKTINGYVETNLDALFDKRISSKDDLTKFLISVLTGYSIAVYESLLQKRLKDGDTVPLRNIKQCFIDKQGAKSFESVVEKMSSKLEIVNDRLQFIPSKRRQKIKPMITEVAGLYGFMIEEDLILNDENLSEVFLSEFGLEINDTTKGRFSRGKLERNRWVSYFKKEYKPNRVHQHIVK